MKILATYIFIVLWFLHLLVGAGAAFTALRLWPSRGTPLIKYFIIYIVAAMLGALEAIVLVFLAKNVIFTWKFTVAIFTFGILQDLVRLPLFLFVLKGRDREN